MLRATTIRDSHADLFSWLGGNPQAQASRCRTPDMSGPDDLVFATDAAQLGQALDRKASIVIVHRKLAPLFTATEHPLACCFSVPAIQLAMTVLLKYFDTKAERFTQWGGHHPTAVVHATARIGENVQLGPYCVIGAEASIGDNCLVGSHTVVENRARVGAHTVLHPHVFIGSGCEVGSRCEIHPHSSIGSDGFGYAVGADGLPLKVPQLGNVSIGDDVEIGSNCAIDRATLTSTFIRSGAKLDNICHIAHNCDLGQNGFYTAGFMMAGSTTIGRNFRTGGNSVVTAHLTLADDVALAGRSTVTNDITEAGQYGGYPLQPLQTALKTLVNLGRLNQLRKDLNRVLKHLKLSDQDGGK
jgi:UDP-3-O-[3-hydroxymyristoyl] glucosamine N-acyltransferase